MDKKRVAVVLSGMHFSEDDAERVVDFRHYFQNIQHHIYNNFQNKGYELDTFLCTNRSKVSNELLRIYEPKRYSFLGNTLKRRIDKTIQGLNLVLEYMAEKKCQYDIVCVTRFDIYFLEELINVDLNKLNIVSTVLTNRKEDENLIDDNFYLFPGSMLQDFFHIFRTFLISIRVKAAMAHWMLPAFQTKFPIHFIKNEKRIVADLTSFKLRFFDSADLILNKFMFSENLKYLSKTKSAQIEIYKKDIHFQKIAHGDSLFCWFGYELEKGKYKVSFEALSDTNIENFHFLKTHNPVQFYPIEPIVQDQPTFVNVDIDIQTKTTCIFIFDSYKGLLDINFKNIRFDRIH